jgi:hypothetical protein
MQKSERELAELSKDVKPEPEARAADFRVDDHWAIRPKFSHQPELP